MTPAQRGNGDQRRAKTEPRDCDQQPQVDASIMGALICVSVGVMAGDAAAMLLSAYNAAKTSGDRNRGPGSSGRDAAMSPDAFRKAQQGDRPVQRIESNAAQGPSAIDANSGNGVAKKVVATCQRPPLSPCAAVHCKLGVRQDSSWMS